jgi:hypothetical protein
LVLSLAVVLCVAGVSGGAERGSTSGVVVGTDVVRQENGPILLSVTIRGEGDQQATFVVGPGNREAYSTVGALRAGDRVVIGWVREGEDVRTWIREIGKRAAERTEGEDGRRQGERGTDAPREGVGERPRGERRPDAPREGTGERNQRRRTRATVVSVTTERGEEGGDGARVITLKAIETGEVTSFTVLPKRADLYAHLAGFKPGDKVVVVWVMEGGDPWLVELGRID